MSTGGMEVCMEDPKEHYNENFGDVEHTVHNNSCFIRRGSEYFKDLRAFML